MLSRKMSKIGVKYRDKMDNQRDPLFEDEASKNQLEKLSLKELNTLVKDGKIEEILGAYNSDEKADGFYIVKVSNVGTIHNPRKHGFMGSYGGVLMETRLYVQYTKEYKITKNSDLNKK